MKLHNFIIAAVIVTVSACTSNNKEEQTAMDNGNAVIETIMSRRSIRSYKQEPVDRQTMEKMVEDECLPG